MTDKIITGALGENLAADYLRQIGFEIVVRNYRFRKAEIDIIARKDDWLLFVEVKTRRSTDYGEPESFVDWKKASLMFMAAEEFIFSTDWHGHVRFDVIAVTLGNEPDIVHFEDAIN